MRIPNFPLVTIAYGLLMAKEANASFRAVPAESAARRQVVVEFPYAFLVSDVRNDQDWCINATNGVANERDLGIAPCEFDKAPDYQLFLLNDDNMIHSKVNDNFCFVIEDDDIRDGHSRLQFGSCNRRLAFNKFLLNRDEMSMLRLENSPSHCIKQTGNGPDTTDSLRTFFCDDDDTREMAWDSILTMKNMTVRHGLQMWNAVKTATVPSVALLAKTICAPAVAASVLQAWNAVTIPIVKGVKLVAAEIVVFDLHLQIQSRFVIQTTLESSAAPIEIVLLDTVANKDPLPTFA